MSNDLASDGLRRCLQKLEESGPMRIPQSNQSEDSSKASRTAWQWILNCEEYLTWSKNEFPQLLRIVWSPTCGKTKISEFLVDSLKQTIRDSSDISLICFLCNNEEHVDTPETIVRSLVFQLLLQRNRLYPYIQSDFEKEDHLNDFAGLWKNLRDMLQKEQLGPVFIVVDSLDACRGSTRTDLLRSIKDLFHCLSSRSKVEVKLLITYVRGSVDIEEELSNSGIVLDLDEKRIDAALAGNTGVVALDYSMAMSRDAYFKPFKATHREEYMSVAESLLNRGASITSMDNKYGRSPLSWAAESGQEQIVKLLLDKGVDIECKDKFGQTPLTFAAEKGHLFVVRLLVHAGGDVDSKDREGYTALMRATKRGHLPVVKFLLGNGATVLCKSINGQTPVSVAAENGHPAIVQALLVGGASADSADFAYGRTPLSRAAERGYESICLILCNKGVDVNSKDVHSETPLHWAARNGHKSCVGQLLRHGASTSVRDSRYHQTPVFWACRNEHESIVKLLVDNGADVDLSDISGRTPLSWAAGNGEPDVMKLLLDSGAKPNSLDRNGRSPLSWAAANGQADSVHQLLDRNAEPSLRDRYGRTPLAWASDNAYGSIVAILRDANCKYNE